MTDKKPFFWLHIKKVAGGTIRKRLSPWYVQAERVHKPVNFIQSDPSAYNDILNNFRVPLGAYQFRRADFARTFLYPETWEGMVRFAFLREPISRCVSAFHYLQKPRGGERSFVQHLIETGQPIPETMEGLFDVFLDLVESARRSASIYEPVNLHFTTHTAPVFPDVTDKKGNLLLSQLFRLEDLDAALEHVASLCGLPRPDMSLAESKNVGDADVAYVPTASQAEKVNWLYADDLLLYETCDRLPIQ